MSWTETPAPSEPPLTEEEIGSLVEGDRVLVLWRGGSEPYDYDVVRMGREKQHVWASREGHLVHPLDSSLSSLDRVWKVPKS